MRYFCPKCGKRTEKWYGNYLCEQCYLTTLKKAIPSCFKMKRCKKCNSVIVNRENHGFEEAVGLILEKYVSYDKFRISTRKGQILLEVTPKDVKKLIKKPVTFKFRNVVCNACKTVRKPIEILQIRGNYTKEILNQVIGGGLAPISKLKALKQGYDLHINGSVEKALKTLKNKYIMDKKISRSLIGVRDGHRVYRKTVLIRVKERVQRSKED